MTIVRDEPHDCYRSDCLSPDNPHSGECWGFDTKPEVSEPGHVLAGILRNYVSTQREVSVHNPDLDGTIMVATAELLRFVSDNHLKTSEPINVRITVDVGVMTEPVE